jgi:hypothetical protein
MNPLALSSPAQPGIGADALVLSSAERDLQRLMQRPHAAPPGHISTQAAQVWVATLYNCDTSQGELQAQDPSGAWLTVLRAHSCLVAPQPGDLVQVVQAGEQCWAVNVLVSATPDQGLVLDANGQKLTLAAQDLHLRATGRLSQEADIRASSARLCIDTIQERQTRVHGTDTLRAQHAMTHVERHHSVHAGSATLTAGSLLKIDAAQIHMG